MLPMSSIVVRMSYYTRLRANDSFLVKSPIISLFKITPLSVCQILSTSKTPPPSFSCLSSKGPTWMVCIIKFLCPMVVSSVCPTGFPGRRWEVGRRLKYLFPQLPSVKLSQAGVGLAGSLDRRSLLLLGMLSLWDLLPGSLWALGQEPKYEFPIACSHFVSSLFCTISQVIANDLMVWSGQWTIRTEPWG